MPVHHICNISRIIPKDYITILKTISFYKHTKLYLQRALYCRAHAKKSRNKKRIYGLQSRTFAQVVFCEILNNVHDRKR